MRDPVQCTFNPLPEPDWLNPVSMRVRSNRIRCGCSQSGFNAHSIHFQNQIGSIRFQCAFAQTGLGVDAPNPDSMRIQFGLSVQCEQTSSYVSVYGLISSFKKNDQKEVIAGP